MFDIHRLSWPLVISAIGVLLLLLVLLIRAIGHVIWRVQRGRLLNSLNDSNHHDLLKLARYHIVRPRATGESILHVQAEIENLTEKRVGVAVLPGTYFVASGMHQNMVVCQEQRFWVEPRATKKLDVRAACINADRPIPRDDDQFYGVARVPGRLRRFLEAARGEHPMVIQAGVWAITDGYTELEIRTKLFATETIGGRQCIVPAISKDQIERAKDILNQLRIRTPLNCWWKAVLKRMWDSQTGIGN